MKGGSRMNTRNKICRSAVKFVLLVCTLALSWPIVANALSHIDIPDIEIPGCEIGLLPPDNPQQIILTCLPPAPVPFNGTLVLYAHGYVNPQEPLALPFDELEDFFPLIGNIQEGGFAFATTSYSKNGYAIEQAGNDLNDLVDHFKDQLPPGALKKVLVAGASEGAGVATMLVETRPDIYDGGLAMCGPVGGMPFQLRYLGDFRVVFDYFFPDVFDFGVYNVPDIDLTTWEKIKQNIANAIIADPEAAEQLFKVAGVAVDPSANLLDLADSAINILKFSILGTNDLLLTAGGKPYGNRFRRYRGSDNDKALNVGVERVASDFIGRKYVRRFYRTTGKLQRPLVTLHTTLDDAVPFIHELIYKIKVGFRGNSHNLVPIPVFRFGHCNFTPQEVLGAFLFLVLMTS
jgi:pimeloyl-ACP methyl ester carboxylesterase